jgi:NADH-quinone oxidoreductase subunit F
MDLHLMAATPTEQERRAVDAVLGPPASGWEGGERSTIDLRVSRDPGDHRTELLPVLHALQSAVGWISEGGMNYACERLQVPPAEAYGVATFYAMFSTREQPPTVLHVCDDVACRVRGGDALADRLEHELSGGPKVVRSPCLGMCDAAPAILFQEAGEGVVSHVVAPADPDQIVALVRGDRTLQPPPGLAPRHGGERLLRRVGLVDPASLQDYRANDGYAALARAIELGPDEVIREITEARLLGRGGAAFPTGVKWRAVADQPPGPRYVVCNADESEPGTFKDRVVMEHDPFSVIEALTIAGFATGAERGYLYVRGEYPRATAHLQEAIRQARDAGLLGPNVLHGGFAFDIELRRGAGAYICGEETALFNSIEGKRGEPRNKPPFPVTHGLFGRPTAINNVETLVNVLPVLTLGPHGYASVGTADSTGTRLFCLSGHIELPGVYEHPHGVTVRDAIQAAGGVRGGAEIGAVLLGGAAGGFIRPDALDAKLTFEDARAGGYTLGSGVIMVFDTQTDIVDLCLRIARFFRDESCGQCVPCRVGTVRQEEALARLVAGRTIGTAEDELALLRDVALVMRDASICGLGQTAANAVQSAVTAFGVFDGAAS